MKSKCKLNYRLFSLCKEVNTAIQKGTELNWVNILAQSRFRQARPWLSAGSLSDGNAQASQREVVKKSLLSILKRGLMQHRVYCVQLYSLFPFYVSRQNRKVPQQWFSLCRWQTCSTARTTFAAGRICPGKPWTILMLVLCSTLKMAYLLMLVTLLHLITLAMLFIATMEKVIITYRTRGLCTCTLLLFHKARDIQLRLSCAISVWSLGGCGMAWRTQTCGTTVGLTTSQEPGCVRPPKKLVKQRFDFVRLQ